MIITQFLLALIGKGDMFLMNATKQHQLDVRHGCTAVKTCSSEMQHVDPILCILVMSDPHSCKVSNENQFYNTHLPPIVRQVCLQSRPIT